MATMARRRRHRAARAAAGRHAHGPGQARAPRRRDRSRSRRPTTSRPRATSSSGTPPRPRPRRRPPGGCSSPRRRAPSARRHRSEAGDRLVARRRRSARSSTCATSSRSWPCHGGTVVEWLVEDGDPVCPGQPLVRLHPEAVSRVTATLRLPGHPPGQPDHVGVGSYRPARVVDQRRDRRPHRLLRRVDPRAHRHRRAPLRRLRRVRVPTWRWPPREKALADAGVAPEDVGMVLLASVTHPYQTPSAAAEVVRPPRREERRRARRRRRVRRLLLRPRPRRHDRAHRHARSTSLVIGVEKLTDFVSLDDRGAVVHLRRRRGCRRRRTVGPPGHRAGRLGRRRRRRRTRSR